MEGKLTHRQSRPAAGHGLRVNLGGMYPESV
jgi:hypothetical protein